MHSYGVYDLYIYIAKDSTLSGHPGVNEMEERRLLHLNPQSLHPSPLFTFIQIQTLRRLKRMLLIMTKHKLNSVFLFCFLTFYVFGSCFRTLAVGHCFIFLKTYFHLLTIPTSMFAMNPSSSQETARENNNLKALVQNRKAKPQIKIIEDAPLVEFMYLVFTRMSG